VFTLRCFLSGVIFGSDSDIMFPILIFGFESNTVFSQFYKYYIFPICVVSVILISDSESDYGSFQM